MKLIRYIAVVALAVALAACTTTETETTDDERQVATTTPTAEPVADRAEASARVCRGRWNGRRLITFTFAGNDVQMCNFHGCWETTFSGDLENRVTFKSPTTGRNFTFDRSRRGYNAAIKLRGKPEEDAQGVFVCRQ